MPMGIQRINTILEISQIILIFLLSSNFFTQNATVFTLGLELFFLLKLSSG